MSKFEKYLEMAKHSSIEPEYLKNQRLKKMKYLQKTYGSYPQFKTLDMDPPKNEIDAKEEAASGEKKYRLLKFVNGTRVRLDPEEDSLIFDSEEEAKKYKKEHRTERVEYFIDEIS
jgi:hypothetical protein